MNLVLLALGVGLLLLAAGLEWRRAPWRQRLSRLNATARLDPSHLFQHQGQWQHWLQARGLWPTAFVWQHQRTVLVISQLSLAALMLLVNMLWPSLTTIYLLLSWLCAAVILLVAQLLWSHRQWLQQCEQQLPQALEQLSRATAAGLGLQQALSQIGEELPAPLADEFGWLLQRLRIGDPIEQVLEQAGERLPLRSYRFFCLALLLNIETGGRLSQVLASQSQQLKARQRAQQKLQTLTSEPRMAANVVALIPLLMFVALFWLSPSHVAFLLHDSSGQSMLGYAVASVLLGLAVIRLLLLRAAR
ncbi:hypothetical protein CHH28_09160 [Bacterioplanes sanyensis]|uniref:Type II secretion system protein GspF domain-containing protein n=1 Tax=Bacterioplanes sanyensis TaxID=1249553 RepID=A0A222FIM3_9GAMM|nr:type II secretion system F family protein [Bacterioplanes sanyensis]ASP38838.1 hypothetical protein CHH28_09160 [Bacterioplanes sanyensis]